MRRNHDNESWVVVRNFGTDKEEFWTGDDWSTNYARAEIFNSSYDIISIIEANAGAVGVINYGLSLEYMWLPCVPSPYIQHDISQMCNGRELDFWAFFLDGGKAKVIGPFKTRPDSYTYSKELQHIDTYNTGQKEAVKQAKSWMRKKGEPELVEVIEI